jgi:hypothetical protein
MLDFLKGKDEKSVKMQGKIPDPKAKPDDKEARGFGPFMLSIFLTLVIVVLYFSFGSVFLAFADFYSNFKMSGRFPDGPPYTTEFPFKNMFTDSDSQSILYRFGRWATDSVIYAFAKNRSLLDTMMDYIGNGIAGKGNIVSSLVLLVAPIFMGLMVFGTYFAGIITTVIGAIVNIGQITPSILELLLLMLPFAIPFFLYLGLVFFATGALSIGTALIQTAMMFGFLFVMPLFNATMREGITNTLINHKYLIYLVLFSIVTANAFTMLGKTGGYVSLGVTLAALLSFIYMKLV